jgi:hypothetical protein
LAGPRDGLVRIHRVVACEKYGRILTSKEHVHHLDENKNNWSEDNIELTNVSQHKTIHNYSRSFGEIRSCGHCGSLIYRSKSQSGIYSNSFCSEEHRGLFDRRLDWPSDDYLKKEVWRRPVVDLAAEFGVSDKAVTKHCRKRGISTPPRGYWTKRKRVP